MSSASEDHTKAGMNLEMMRLAVVVSSAGVIPSRSGCMRPVGSPWRIGNLTEHRIRLRGGWTCRPAGSAEAEERPLHLPVRWSCGGARRLVLTRRFGRPPLDRGRQILLLQMERVRGIRALVLNGQHIAPGAVENSRFEIEIPDLADRNVLILEIELHEQGPSGSGSSEEWGVIALIVRTVEPAQ
jgi:hypothetical protein